MTDSQRADDITQLVELAERDGWTLRLAWVRGDLLSVHSIDQVVRAELDAPHAEGDAPGGR